MLLRLGYFWTVRDGPLGNGDSLAYEGLAQKLLSHQPYSTTAKTRPGGFPGTFNPPGYPAFLAAVDLLLGPSRVHTALGRPRFRVPAVLALAILAAIGGTTLIERRWPSRHTKILTVGKRDAIKVARSMTGANALLSRKRIFYNTENPGACPSILQP